MKKIALVLIMLLISVSVWAQQTYTIKIATVAPEGSVWMKVMNKLKKALEKDSNGRIKLRFYPGGVLGDDKVVINKMKLGQVQAAGLTGVGLGSILPELRIMESPFMFTSYKQYDCVLNKLKGDFEKKLESKGFVVLGWADQGFVYLMSKKKIDTTEAVKKTKPWVWEADPVAKAAFEAFGIHPVPMALQDVFNGLQTGMIDTVYISPIAAIALQWYTKLKYIADVPIVDGLGAFVISKAYLDKMPDDLKKLLLNKTRKYLRVLVKVTRVYNTKSLKILQKKGLTLLKASDQQKKEFKQTGMKAAKSLIGKLYSADLFNRFTQILSQCGQ